MARARTLKPGFFLNELLAELHPLARLLFAGLWTLADREGRLEDRPKRIKAAILPYDDCDVDAFLQQLHDRGFILRYEVAGERYIQVVNFRKHQTPHVREPASTIPAPDEHSASTVQEQDQHESGPSLSPFPITLSKDEQQQGHAPAHAHEAAATTEPPTEQPAESHQTSPPDIHPSVIGWRRWWWERTASAPPQAGRAADIDTYAAGGMSVELVTNTIEAAIGKAHDPLSYAAGVLARLWAAGVRTVAEAEEYERRIAAEEAKRKQGARQRDAPAKTTKPQRPPMAYETDEDRYWEDPP